MNKANLYSIKGTSLGTFSLPKSFDAEINMKLLAQAVHVYEDRAHIGLAKTKTRSEVNRTKKKWYKQKGTGGARHGARSAHIFIGGGVAHGPQPVKRELTLPLKMRRKSLEVVLTLKAKAKEILVVDGISKITKTKEAKAFLFKIVKGEGRKIKRWTFVLGDTEKEIYKFLSNLKNVNTILYKDLNAYAVFNGGVLIFSKNLFESKKEAKKNVEKIKTTKKAK